MILFGEITSFWVKLKEQKESFLIPTTPDSPELC